MLYQLSYTSVNPISWLSTHTTRRLGLCGYPAYSPYLEMEHRVLERSQYGFQRSTLQLKVCRPASMANSTTSPICNQLEVGGYKNRTGVDTGSWKLAAMFLLAGVTGLEPVGGQHYTALVRVKV